MTFRTRMLLTFLLLFTVSFFLFIVYFYQMTSSETEQKTLNELRSDAVWTLDDLSEQLETLQMELAAMATARIWYDDSPLEYRQARLKTYKKIYPLYEHITLYDMRGMVLADSDGKNKDSLDNCFCWKGGSAGEKGYHFVAEKGAHDSVIHFYQGVMNLKGQLTTVLTGEIPLSRLVRHMRGGEKYPHSDFSAYLFELIAADGNTLYTVPNTNNVGNREAGWDSLKNEIDRLKSNNERSSAWPTNNSLDILAVSEQNPENEHLQLFMRIHVNKEVLFDDIRKQGQKISLLAVFMLGVSGLFIWVASAQLSNPIRKLSDLVHEVGTGNFDSVKSLPARTDEFSGLVESMRMMGSRLEAARAELKKQEEVTRQNEKKFRTVADFTLDWEYWLSPEAGFIYMSPSCERITGYSAAEFQQNPSLLTQIIHPEDRAGHEDHLGNALHEDEDDRDVHDAMEYRIVTKGGKVLWISHICRSIIDENGLFLGRRVSNRDITERKEFERIIQKLNSELESKVLSRTAELESTVRELEEICYAISHEVRAPLSRIEGFCAALSEDFIDKESSQRFCVDRLAAASLQVRDVIDGLLLFTRLMRTDICRQQLDLSKEVADIAAELTSKTPERFIELVIMPAVSASADPELIRILLRALLDNAVKFTAHSPSARIEFGMQVTQGDEVIFLKDNGIGFDMSYAEELFTTFWRMHTQKDFAGHGLGLAMAKRIIERHGGVIWADSRPSDGTVFYFTLPATMESIHEDQQNTAG